MLTRQDLLDGRFPDDAHKHSVDTSDEFHKRLERERLARDVNHYLASGGVITWIPPGRSAVINRYGEWLLGATPR